MFYRHFRSEHYRVRQLISAPGWRMLLGYTAGDEGNETVEVTLTHLVGWALLEPRDKTHADWGEANVVPVVPDPQSRILTFDFAMNGLASVLLQPGAEPTPDQEAFVRKYALEICAEADAYYDALEKAEEMRRAGWSFEAIAAKTGLEKYEARQIAIRVDHQIAEEKQRVSAVPDVA